MDFPFSLINNSRSVQSRSPSPNMPARVVSCSSNVLVFFSNSFLSQPGMGAGRGAKPLGQESGTSIPLARKKICARNSETLLSDGEANETISHGCPAGGSFAAVSEAHTVSNPNAQHLKNLAHVQWIFILLLASFIAGCLATGLARRAPLSKTRFFPCGFARGSKQERNNRHNDGNWRGHCGTLRQSLSRPVSARVSSRFRSSGQGRIRTPFDHKRPSVSSNRVPGALRQRTLKSPYARVGDVSVVQIQTVQIGQLCKMQEPRVRDPGAFKNQTRKSIQPFEMLQPSVAYTRMAKVQCFQPTHLLDTLQAFVSDSGIEKNQYLKLA